MRFRVLGPLEVEGDAGPIAVPGRRPAALLTALLLHPGAVVATDRLVDSVWGDQPPEAPANALQQVVARLRSRLAAGGPDLADALVTAPGGYLLSVPPEAVDAEQFERGYRLSRQYVDDDPQRAADLLDEVLPLWRGPAYGEHADGFAHAPSVRLTELRTAAREDRAELDLRLGHAPDAVAAARDLVAEHPLRDRPVEVLMRALHATGRVPDALEAYRAHRDRLAAELGLDPAPALAELEGQILRGELTALPRPRTADPTGSPTSAESAVREVDPVARALPWRPAGLIGRDQDLVLLEGCLAEQRVVTLVGPGGVGKTRLALEAAHRASTAGRRVWWADLTTVRPGRVLDALAEATGVEMPRGDDVSAHFAASLHRSSGLLCLDNAESVLDDLANVVESLSAAAPRLTVLATSRERLAVAAEHVHQIAPLSLPTATDPGPAVELFLARAVALEAGALNDDDIADIAELCRRLDGLPLAIELGAARAPSFGIRQFTEQVAVELDLLAGGRRTAASRHQTLRAVVDASYRLLTPDEALLLERLGVFPGRFDLAAVRAVCVDDRLPRTSVAALLARLVEQSLVQAGAGRFWLLDTLRTYADELLTDDSRRRLRERHARHVADRLGELDWTDHPESEAAGVVEIAAMTADLHQAWSHALEHDRQLAVELAARIYDFAYPRQRRDLLDWGRQVADWDVEHPLLPLAWATAVSAAWGSGDFAEADRI
ncbi:MAG TPA: BTAD domain-containing putative transcriptional regulator, partial [Actinomycetes bacterium]|nr:BTAD domain-containing putative transcriptional regulator [Actinomycetes bacterium]